MKIEYQNNSFVVSFKYDPGLVAAVKSLPSRRYDPNTKTWSVPVSEAQPLYSLLRRLNGVEVEYGVGAKEALDQAHSAAMQAIKASQATTTDQNIPCPDGLAYLPFQKAGIVYAQTRPATLIGDEMGLGKTIQAIGIANSDPTIKTALIICPASLKINWSREWKKWCVRSMSIGVVNGNGMPDTDVVIINYDILKKHHVALRDKTWDLLVADECHYVKNKKAARTAELLGRWNKDPDKVITPIPAKRRVFLTGTPILNRPIELWPLVHALDPSGLGASWYKFVTQYCDGHKTRYGWDVNGASNLNELQDRLRTSIMVRRLKADVLAELPAKRRAVVVLPTNGAMGAVQAESQAYEVTQARTLAARAAVELAKASGSDEAYTEAVQRLRDETKAAFEEISRARHMTALKKIPAVIDYITDVLESEKVVLFAHHLDVIDQITAAFPNCAVLTGQHTQEQRQEAVDRFQNDPSCQLFVGSIKAAGVGITLTAASHVIFAELDWVPGNVTQAEDRCHRIGQQDHVLVEHLVFDGSLDARMAQTLVDKQAIIDAALDDKERAELAAIDVSPDEPATKSASKTKIEKAANELTPELIAQVHTDLRTIAGMCDGAQELDGYGFSKIDAHIGHALANAPQLTPRQAALGAILTNKYRRQLGR